MTFSSRPDVEKLKLNRNYIFDIVTRFGNFFAILVLFGSFWRPFFLPKIASSVHDVDILAFKKLVYVLRGQNLAIFTKMLAIFLS